MRETRSEREREREILGSLSPCLSSCINDSVVMGPLKAGPVLIPPSLYLTGRRPEGAG